MRRFELPLSKIEDDAVVEAVKALRDGIVESALAGFRGRHFEIVREAGTYSWPHRLGFTPRDVLQTFLRVSTGTGTWTWDYDSFDKDYVTFTVTTSTSGATVTVRAFIGRYGES